MGEHWGGPPTLTPPSLTLLSAKPRQKLRRCHFGVGMVQAAKQGHTMGLCSGFPYQLPPQGASPGLEEAHCTQTQTSVRLSVCPAEDTAILACTVQKQPLGGKQNRAFCSRRLPLLQAPAPFWSMLSPCSGHCRPPRTLTSNHCEQEGDRALLLQNRLKNIGRCSSPALPWVCTQNRP